MQHTSMSTKLRTKLPLNGMRLNTIHEHLLKYISFFSKGNKYKMHQKNIEAQTSSGTPKNFSRKSWAGFLIKKTVRRRQDRVEAL